MSKEMLADALRRYPTWGDAYIAELQRADRLAAVVKAAWGTLLAYYTDIPEAEVQRLIAACESVNDLLDSPAGDYANVVGRDTQGRDSAARCRFACCAGGK